MTADVNDLLTRYRDARAQCAATAKHNLDAVAFYDAEIARLEQDPTAVPAQPTESRAAMAAALHELRTRRTVAFTAGYGLDLSTQDRLALIAEATTADDVDLINDAVSMLDEFSRTVATLRTDVWREFGKGRCSVCGRTAKQNAALGYDCATGC
ncbi:hypothetical protein ACWGJ9_11850 [Curtobacterium citreum]